MQICSDLLLFAYKRPRMLISDIEQVSIDVIDQTTEVEGMDL